MAKILRPRSRNYTPFMRSIHERHTTSDKDVPFFQLFFNPLPPDPKPPITYTLTASSSATAPRLISFLILFVYGFFHRCTHGSLAGRRSRRGLDRLRSRARGDGQWQWQRHRPFELRPRHAPRFVPFLLILGVNHHHPGSIVGWASTFPVIFRNYGARKFMSGVAVLIPIVATLYLTWWFIEFFDTFFSPIYDRIFYRHVFGLGFITAMVFIFLTGVFTTSWIGSWLHAMSESAFSRVPVVKHIYSTAKQIAAAVR